MTLIDTTELKFARGYYHIGFHGFGVVTLDDDTPPEIRDRFWKVRSEFHKKVVDMEKRGIYDSRYPDLPFEDPEENKNIT